MSATMDRSGEAARQFERFQSPNIPLALIVKHSDLCGLSELTMGLVLRACERLSPDTPRWLLIVQDEPFLSQDVAAYFGVRHETPQVIVLRQGQVAETRSHRNITEEWLAHILSPCRVETSHP